MGETDELAEAPESKPHKGFVVVPTNERVATMETRLEIFLEEQFPSFRAAVESEFRDVKDQIAHISPNGQTPRLIEMGKALGDPEQITTLKEMVEDHQYRRRLFRPWRGAGNTFVTAVVYSVAIAGVAALGAFGHYILHALHLFGVN